MAITMVKGRSRQQCQWRLGGDMRLVYTVMRKVRHIWVFFLLIMKDFLKKKVLVYIYIYIYTHTYLSNVCY